MVAPVIVALGHEVLIEGLAVDQVGHRRPGFGRGLGEKCDVKLDGRFRLSRHRRVRKRQRRQRPAPGAHVRQFQRSVLRIPDDAAPVVDGCDIAARNRHRLDDEMIDGLGGNAGRESERLVLGEHHMQQGQRRIGRIGARRQHAAGDRRCERRIDRHLDASDQDHLTVSGSASAARPVTGLSTSSRSKYSPARKSGRTATPALSR